MDKNTKELLEEIANALASAALLATRVRRTASEHADDALKLEASVDRAVRAIKRFSPEGR
jgi:hypothetical protein